MLRFVLGLLYFFRFHFMGDAVGGWADGGLKSLRTGGELKNILGLDLRVTNFRAGGYFFGGYFYWGRGGGQYPFTCHAPLPIWQMELPGVH